MLSPWQQKCGTGSVATATVLTLWHLLTCLLPPFLRVLSGMCLAIFFREFTLASGKLSR